MGSTSIELGANPTGAQIHKYSISRRWSWHMLDLTDWWCFAISTGTPRRRIYLHMAATIEVSHTPVDSCLTSSQKSMEVFRLTTVTLQLARLNKARQEYPSGASSEFPTSLHSRVPSVVLRTATCTSMRRATGRWERISAKPSIFISQVGVTSKGTRMSLQLRPISCYRICVTKC